MTLRTSLRQLTWNLFSRSNTRSNSRNPVPRESVPDPNDRDPFLYHNCPGRAKLEFKFQDNPNLNYRHLDSGDFPPTPQNQALSIMEDAERTSPCYDPPRPDLEVDTDHGKAFKKRLLKKVPSPKNMLKKRSKRIKKRQRAGSAGPALPDPNEQQEYNRLMDMKRCQLVEEWGRSLNKTKEETQKIMKNRSSKWAKSNLAKQIMASKRPNEESSIAEGAAPSLTSGADEAGGVPGGFFLSDHAESSSESVGSQRSTKAIPAPASVMAEHMQENVDKLRDVYQKEKKKCNDLTYELEILKSTLEKEECARKQAEENLSRNEQVCEVSKQKVDTLEREKKTLKFNLNQEIFARSLSEQESDKLKQDLNGKVDTLEFEKKQLQSKLEQAEKKQKASGKELEQVKQICSTSQKKFNEICALKQREVTERVEYFEAKLINCDRDLNACKRKLEENERQLKDCNELKNESQAKVEQLNSLILKLQSEVKCLKEVVQEKDLAISEMNTKPMAKENSATSPEEDRPKPDEGELCFDTAHDDSIEDDYKTACDSNVNKQVKRLVQFTTTVDGKETNTCIFGHATADSQKNIVDAYNDGDKMYCFCNCPKEVPLDHQIVALISAGKDTSDTNTHLNYAGGLMYGGRVFTPNFPIIDKLFESKQHIQKDGIKHKTGAERSIKVLLKHGPQCRFHELKSISKKKEGT